MQLLRFDNFAKVAKSSPVIHFGTFTVGDKYIGAGVALVLDRKFMRTAFSAKIACKH